VRGADSITKWWWHCLEIGEISTTEYENLAPDWESKPSPPILKEDLYQAYVKWVGKGKHSEHITSFGRKIKKLAKPETKRPVFEGTQRWCYVLPRLDECRAHFEKQIKQPIAWGDGVEAEAA